MKSFFVLLLVVCTFQIECEQKNIAIFAYEDQRLQPWDPDTVKSGIVGSEEAIIYASKELAELGYRVVVYAYPPENSPHSTENANPRFLRSSQDDGKQFDIAIAWRGPWRGRELKKRAKAVYFWPHDVAQGVYSSDEIDAFDDILWLSHWQRENWIASNPGMAKFTHIFGNGINLKMAKMREETKNPYSCIYGSNYGQGLDLILDAWPEVKKQFPEATLDIYYGWSHWGFLTPEKEEKMRKQITELASLGVKEHGRVGHEELQEAYALASLWIYPCARHETFCITALRAQASGAIPVIVEKTALKETVRHGFKCSSQQEFFVTLIHAMKNVKDVTLEERKKMRAFIEEEFTWHAVAMRWKKVFDEGARPELIFSGY